VERLPGRDLCGCDARVGHGVLILTWRDKFAASLIPDDRAMDIDSKTRELANAHDAVDRLQAVKEEMERRAIRREMLHDRIVRSITFAMTAVVVLIAIWKL